MTIQSKNNLLIWGLGVTIPIILALLTVITTVTLNISSDLTTFKKDVNQRHVIDSEKHERIEGFYKYEVAKNTKFREDAQAK